MLHKRSLQNKKSGSFQFQNVKNDVSPGLAKYKIEVVEKTAAEARWSASRKYARLENTISHRGNIVTEKTLQIY